MMRGAFNEGEDEKKRSRQPILFMLKQLALEGYVEERSFARALIQFTCPRDCAISKFLVTTSTAASSVTTSIFMASSIKRLFSKLSHKNVCSVVFLKKQNTHSFCFRQIGSIFLLSLILRTLSARNKNKCP